MDWRVGGLNLLSVQHILTPHTVNQSQQVRLTFLVDLLAKRRRHVMLVGTAGTGQWIDDFDIIYVCGFLASAGLKINRPHINYREDLPPLGVPAGAGQGRRQAAVRLFSLCLSFSPLTCVYVYPLLIHDTITPH